MKRLLVLTPLSLAAVLLITSLAEGQLVITRVSPQSLSSSTTPKRDRTRPYTFTTTGRLTPPPVCDTIGATGCVPLVCPPGATNPVYCFRPTAAVLCTGKVTVTFKKLLAPISSRIVTLRPDCTYRSTVSFRTRNPFRRGTLRVLVRFEGNVLLLPKSASTKTVRAG